ncbi:hypothetical protein CAC42_2576 [Sphaceloma murrayae]|uniref:Heme oxygenase-like protein n=1 Tax=Sphaceloma murrayae TaxID=2082308 RepID=A0A2K1QWL1_9PEZI|nr:hypothetical protein CAC42_2576 [Sphaceloma murrayae]
MASPEEPARLLSPPPPAAAETLPFRINAATRQIHTSLNQLVTSRLLLALPPHSTTPILYLHGIHSFAQLYFTFEDTWQDLICAHLSASSPFVPPHTDGAPAPLPSEIHRSQLRTYLSTLVPPTLWRTQRLEADIARLSSRFDITLPDRTQDGLVQELNTHIQTEVAAKPHLLLAYSWVLYMAIFSGGRWIRAQMREAGAQFWGHEDVGTEHGDTGSDEGIELFCFDGKEDGEDIKRFFKEKFAQADDVLTEEEKGDVVLEAGWIFAACVRMVEDLDLRLGTMERHHLDVKRAQPASTRGKEHRRDERGLPEVMRQFLPSENLHNPTIYPGTYITKGLDPFATMLAIAIGLGGWYVLHSWGVIGQGLLSKI